MVNRRQKLKLAQEVFDMATCYSEEPDCWFQPWFFAWCLDVHVHDLEDVLAYLQAQNRLRVRYDANGSCHVRVPSEDA